MPTTLTIKDNTRGAETIFTVTFPEMMPLDIGMFDSGKNYSYSIGTVDTDDTPARMRFTHMLQNIQRHLGRRNVVQEVHLANDETFVKMLNARLTITDRGGDLFLEMECSDIKPKDNKWFLF